MALLTTNINNMNLATLFNKEEFKLNENIGIEKVYGEQRCSWCHSFIRNAEWCLVLYDVEISKKTNFIKKGGGVYVHLDCIETLGRKINWLKEMNIRKIVMKKLRD